MTNSNSNNTADNWSGRMGFVFAATGSAVGLGNIWKFPYITGENGGGAFVLFYLGCIVVFGIPLMMAELLVGRRGASSPSECFETLAQDNGRSRRWSVAGNSGVLASFLILSFYSVVGGWSVSYVVNAATNTFDNVGADAAAGVFTDLLGSAGTGIFWHTIFMLAVATVVVRGINRGIERVVSVLMPLMFVLLLILVGYAVSLSSFDRAVAFLFEPDFSKFTVKSALLALGHSFFTLSLGMSVMVAYSSHLPKNISIGSASITISILDTLCALMAGLAIFTIAFDNDMQLSAGPGLVFQTMPIAFGQIEGGYLIGLAFFSLLLFAAWTSAISLLEPVIERVMSLGSLSRGKSVLIAAGAAWTLGIACSLSFNLLADFKPIGGLNIFDLTDFFASNILLPLTGLLVALFCGWVMSAKSTREELALHNPLVFGLWRVSVRYICPILVTIVFIESALPGTLSALVG